jgi:ribonuclease D
MFAKSITAEEIKILPLKSFEGEIIVVDKQELISEAVSYLRHQRLLGFDTETKPSFKKGRSNQVALLQLSTRDKAFLFRLNRIPLYDGLLEVLSDENILKVGAAIKDDIRTLEKCKQFKPGGFIELQDYVKDFEIENKALSKLSAIVLDFRISKSQQLSNWENEILTLAQQRYAATDAWVSYEIFEKLESVKKQNH